MNDHIKAYVQEDGMIWVSKCTHMGEVRLFNYILATFNRHDATWANTRQRRLAIKQLHGLEESTIFNYLKLLTKSKLLIKMGKGEYKVNAEYVEFGSATTKPE